jgi:hypothetical protein
MGQKRKRKFYIEEKLRYFDHIPGALVLVGLRPISSVPTGWSLGQSWTSIVADNLQHWVRAESLTGLSVSAECHSPLPPIGESRKEKRLSVVSAVILIFYYQSASLKGCEIHSVSVIVRHICAGQEKLLGAQYTGNASKWYLSVLCVSDTVYLL